MEIKRILIVSIAISLFYASTVLGFSHPGLLNTAQDLEFIKEKVNAGLHPWKSGYDAMFSNREARSQTSLDCTPEPFKSVDCGWYNTPQ